MRVENRAPREAFLPMIEENVVWIEALATESRKTRQAAGF
jgi:hypothetical protein